MVDLTNVELAKHYLGIATVYTGNTVMQGLQKRNIEKADSSISEFYQKQGSLDNFPLGPKTRGILELILELGPEKAREQVVLSKEDEIRREQRARYDEHISDHEHLHQPDSFGDDDWYYSDDDDLQRVWF